jgi:ABC-type multidrug transport system ATPase subunit
MDEPTAGVDPIRSFFRFCFVFLLKKSFYLNNASRRDILKLVYAKRASHTIAVSTHIMEVSELFNSMNFNIN